MLDTDTKRRIDTARDILVGKVPDPKSQVEQITIALIYKFMDDIDAESEEWGGERSFFAGEFARYGWARLMRSGLGGHETLNLYAEAITRMPENPGVPQLFRDIFNNAYLPYRDPETLRAFLKTIDQFSYDHSERLGDAYEYLLSVLGSQGDAGQFRTPRHIIDFIVAVLDPKKHETILDPACGTAGFLISSYKRILAANTGEDGQTTLTPDDRGRLAESFTGYDIDPGMVRLARVNMYLHDFADPHIYEYDTLTSEDRWNDYADVILANPPFMTPKGGIQPHNRFSVKARRSEVLFVDYMAEHLTPSGRAGIIVPEGIIFQSQKAHTQLRKILVENYLVAVVSLPGGVFKPYSGVKTSILILDKSLAKRTDRIAFFKIENDGFDLGDQRKPIDRNDLPRVQAEITEYLSRLRAGKTVAGIAESSAEYTTGEFTDGSQPRLGLIVEKAKVAADGSYGLSGERYRSSGTKETSYEWAELREVILGKPQYGSGARKVSYDGKVRYVRITDLTDNGDLKPDDPVSPSVIQPDLFLEPGDLLIARSGSVGRTYLHRDLPGTYQYAGYLIRFRLDPKKALPEYIFHISKSDSWQEWISSNSKTGTLTNINAKQYGSFRFPLPPLDVQKEIVAEIEGYQRVTNGARMVVDNYRPHIAIDPEWPLFELGKLIDVLDSMRKPITKHERTPGPYPYYGATGILDHVAGYLFDEPLVLIGEDGAKWSSGENTAYSITGKTWVNNHAHVLRPDRTKLLDQFLVALIVQIDLSPFITGVTVPKLNQAKLRSIPLPLPPLETQQAIVAEIEAERVLVDANRKLIERMERKIAAAIARAWTKST